MRDPHPTLDQIQVFLAVVETGSFVAAGRRLGRATSVVSYAIANLEAQLGLSLFERSGTRRPRLTEAGNAILTDAKTIEAALSGLLARSRGLNAGLEGEVNLVVDVMLPTAPLVEALEAFQARYPTVALRLHTEALGAVAQFVIDGTAGVGIAGPLPLGSERLVRRQVGTTSLVPVAAPGHPLAAMAGPLTPGAVRDHVQLVLTDRSRLTAGQDFQVLAAKTWRLADLGAKHALLRAGLGWGSMPEAMVAADIAAGTLVRLALDTWDAFGYPFFSLHRPDCTPGPAARWLLERLTEALTEPNVL